MFFLFFFFIFNHLFDQIINLQRTTLKSTFARNSYRQNHLTVFYELWSLDVYISTTLNHLRMRNESVTKTIKMGGKNGAINFRLLTALN